ncbi:MAG: hypothetical protein NC926_01225 [Candidatus Omnitrophica bacterium]|nr:hypothetical protein [Candidatus Omnitrophota bacterium]MCM8806571.1 hypothetical protein [Candidatus Omnitrophota bacterium]
MKKNLILFFLLILIFVSCKKEKKEDLTPLNAPLKYGATIEKTMKKAKAMEDILYLKNKINTFQIQEGRYPESLDELVEKKYIEKIPNPPKGMKFVYDPKTGKVDVK